MRICVIGAGAMGSSYGGLLKASGHEVALVDRWREHVEAIGRSGLRLEGVRGEHRLAIAAGTEPPAGFAADVAMIWTDSNNTAAAAETARAALAPGGFAITMQNGVGNVETLIATLGKARVAGGSSMCSAAMRAPGHAALTHMGTTSVGEVGGGSSARIDALVAALTGAGFEARSHADIMSLIWTKFALNCSINAICATTGLRLGELARLPATDRMQDLIIDEVLAVTKARGTTLTDPDFRNTVKSHCWKKFSRPSMLQAIDAGKRTEVDALNMKIVEEGKRLGVPTPYNEALSLLCKGVEYKAVHARGLDEAAYVRLEADAAGTTRPTR